MIIEILLDAIEAAFNFVVGFFPTSSFNPVTMFGGALNYLGGLDYFLPIHELAGLVLAFVFLSPVFLGTSLFLWLVALIRGGSSRG